MSKRKSINGLRLHCLQPQFVMKRIDQDRYYSFNDERVSSKLFEKVVASAVHVYTDEEI